MCSAGATDRTLTLKTMPTQQARLETLLPRVDLQPLVPIESAHGMPPLLADSAAIAERPKSRNKLWQLVGPLATESAEPLLVSGGTGFRV